MADITLWKPETHVVLHQALGKLAEETGELQQIVARCLIQGIEASDPKTGQPNRERLEEEIADVVAAARWLNSVGLLRVLADRERRKLAGFRKWEKMLEIDLSITSGVVRTQIIGMIANLTGFDQEVIEDRSDEPMTDFGLDDDRKIALSADIWEAMRVPINIAIKLKDDAAVDELVETIENSLRKLAETSNG